VHWCQWGRTRVTELTLQAHASSDTIIIAAGPVYPYLPFYGMDIYRIHLKDSRGIITSCPLPATLFNTPNSFFVLLCSPLLCIGMDAAFGHNTGSQVSPDYHRQPHRDDRPLSTAASLSPTLVDDTHHSERPALKLRIPGGASNILNSTVVDIAGRSLYSTLSDSKRTKLVSYRDNVEVATIQWDRHSPRMVFRHKKMKCKEWLKLAGPNNEYMPIPVYS
jgi:hypothetical protein